VVSPQPRCACRRRWPVVEGSDHPYSMMNALTLGPKGIRINCTRPEVTETPILDLIAGNLATQAATQGS
jgi:hypothetical protein